MKEIDVRDKLNTLFRSLNYNADTVRDGIVCPRCQNVIVPVSGRPDVTMVHPTGRSCYVEVKVVRSGEKSFPFSRITEDQRGKLSDWADRGGMGYLGLGVIVPHGTREKLGQLCLVEWRAWLVMEAKLCEHQNSIPVVAGKGFSKVLQAQKLDIVTLLSDWQVSYVRGSGWQLPMTHPAQHQLRLVD